MVRRFQALLLAVLVTAWAGRAAAESCLTAQRFDSLSTTQFSLPQGSSLSRLQIQGLLLYRELLAGDDHYWIGLELVEPTLSLDGQDGSSPVYSVPFAARISRGTGRVTDWHYNANLKPDDRDKLNGIYQTLHLNPAPADANPADYTLLEADTVGQYRARYVRLPDGMRLRSKEAYTRLRATSGSTFDLSEVIVHADEFSFQGDRCWHTEVSGRSDIELRGGSDLSIRVRQRLLLERSQQPIPASARLPELPLNPLEWPPIPDELIYPPEPREPLATVEDFLRELSALESASREELKAFLYDNDQYLLAIGEQIRAGLIADDFERSLLLAVGQADTAAAHQLLTDLAVDMELDDEARFRSLMALKYAENPIADADLEALFGYAENVELAGDDAEIANTAMLVLGIIAEQQGDSDFGLALSEQLMTQLYATTSDDRAAALLTAVGNSGNLELVDGVSDFLERDDNTLRARAAEALGRLPSPAAEETLRDHLSSEPDTGVQVATLKAMGRQAMSSQSVDTVMEFAARDRDQQVRRAAIESLANQADSNPDIKPKLKQLMRGERDRRNLQTLMHAIY